MALTRVSVDDRCKDGFDCPAVWHDQDDPEHAVVVGTAPTAGLVAVGSGQAAVRVRHQVLNDAGLPLGHLDDGHGHAVVVGTLARPGTVPLGPGEIAVWTRVGC